ncbi:unnamed protein product [Adineta ricciae]|uniref:DDE Tnp4 domain-containing protein n=1 Tax=Adineta ricciae TaxID=249248 RepID=A0A815TBU6_ADIRI|nr:unnamed protein product [Adineta ricciae]CAF1650534.1 unnamed protein product [Adineta ricciae]
MEMLAFQPAMPDFLNGRKQFTTEEANKTRCITKTRWVVESVNSKIKRWRYFSQVIPNSSINHIGEDLSNVCVIINSYCSPATLNVHGDQDIAAKMLQQLKKDNLLQKHLDELENQKLLKWKKHDGVFCLFPSLTPNDVENITFGSYQIHRAKSYIEDHLKPAYYDPNELIFYVEIPDGFDNLVRARFQSGHSTRKFYISTIQFDNTATDVPIQGWCCTCTVGLRVVGCCSHVCGLLWHLGVNRGIVNNSNRLSASYFKTVIDDSMVFTDDDDSSDDDNNIKYSLSNHSTGTDSEELSDSDSQTEEE